jgi:hypothetical protein
VVAACWLPSGGCGCSRLRVVRHLRRQQLSLDLWVPHLTSVIEVACYSQYCPEDLFSLVSTAEICVSLARLFAVFKNCFVNKGSKGVPLSLTWLANCASVPSKKYFQGCPNTFDCSSQFLFLIDATRYLNTRVHIYVFVFRCSNCIMCPLILYKRFHWQVP